MCAVLVLSLGGFTGKEDPAQVYRDYAAKSMEAGSRTADCQMAITMKMGAQELTVDMDLDMQVTYADGNYEMAMTGKAKMEDMSLPVSLYYKDGVCYMDMMGQKLKTKMDIEKTMATAGGVDPAILLNYMDKLTFEASGNGGVLSYRISQAKMNRYVMDVLQLTGQAMPKTATAMAGVKMGSLVGETTLDKDGRAKTEEVKMNLFITAEGKTIPVSMKITCAYQQQGQDFVIQFPDLTGYTEAGLAAA